MRYWYSTRSTKQCIFSQIVGPTRDLQLWHQRTLVYSNCPEILILIFDSDDKVLYDVLIDYTNPLSCFRKKKGSLMCLKCRSWWSTSSIRSSSIFRFIVHIWWNLWSHILHKGLKSTFTESYILMWSYEVSWMYLTNQYFMQGFVEPL